MAAWRQDVAAESGRVTGRDPSSAARVRALAIILSPMVWLERRLDAERTRLGLWLPVGFGAGIALYLVRTTEPDLLSWVSAALGFGTLGALARGPLTLRVCLVALAVFALGHGYAQYAARQAAAPVLTQPLNGVLIDATIVQIDPLERGGARLILNPLSIEHWPGPLSPRIRINLRQFPDDLSPGDHVQMRGGLMPPPHPIVPGGYDLARALWFQRIGAVGFAFGAPTVLAAAPQPDGLIDQARLSLAQLRHEVAKRIQAVLPGGSGGVANALLTGVKGHIPHDTVTELRDAGLAHLLVVAGMHMGFVCAIVFLVVRGGLALIPRIALYHPIKKWAAAATIVVCFLYLLLTGAAAPTQRAFVMILLVMVAILIDRRAISMRLLALGAMVVMVVAPEAVVGPSFQMSFAAVTALIAIHEEALGARVPSFGDGLFGGMGDHVVAVGLTTVIASLATEPFAAFHFDHIALYSIPANMIAVPITAFWSMPWGLAALAAMPFGLEAPFLTMMGFGIDGVIWVAHRLTSLPYAVIHVPAMPPSSLLLMALGLAWLCLWLTSWRYLGLLPMLAAFGLWAAAPVPDLIVDATGKTIAIRAPDGQLKFLPGRLKSAAAETWLEQDGLGRAAPVTASPNDGVICDRLGCVWRRPDGALVAVARQPMALIDDCSRALIVITSNPVGLCPSAHLVIDKVALAQLGAHAVRFGQSGMAIETAISADNSRPWVLAQRSGSVIKPLELRNYLGIKAPPNRIQPKVQAQDRDSEDKDSDNDDSDSLDPNGDGASNDPNPSADDRAKLSPKL